LEYSDSDLEEKWLKYFLFAKMPLRFLMILKISFLRGPEFKYLLKITKFAGQSGRLLLAGARSSPWKYFSIFPIDFSILLGYHAYCKENSNCPMKYLSPKNDFVFKKIYAEHKAILADFLSAALERPETDFQTLELLNPNLEKDVPVEKLGILDVRVRTNEGILIDIEIQLQSQVSIWERMQFYTSKMYAGQLAEGENYSKIRQAIAILIADFPLTPDDDCHHQFTFHDKVHGLDYRNSCEIHFLEISKARKAALGRLVCWLFFLSAETEEEFMAVAATNPHTNDAFVVKKLSADERARALAEAYEKARRDEQDRLEGALLEGEQKGRLEGEQKGRLEVRLETAVQALKKGLTPQLISEITGLSAVEVESLAASLHG
jgi:predicted transposase/invertase (TIGR01784 family)